MRTYTVTEYDMEDYKNYRDGLTTQDVINALKHINRGYIGDYDYSGTEDDYKRFTLHETLYKAIEILEKVRADK